MWEMAWNSATAPTNQMTTDQMPLDEMRRTAARMKMEACQQNLDMLALKEMQPCPTCGKRINVKLPRTLFMCRHIWQLLVKHTKSDEQLRGSFATLPFQDRLSGLDVEFYEDGPTS